MVISEVFPCRVVNFPCCYLGIPLSLGRLSRADEQKLVDAIATGILVWKSGLLTNADRVLLTKVTLSAIPVHVTITTCLSAWAMKEIDKWRSSRPARRWCRAATARWLGMFSVRRHCMVVWVSASSECLALPSACTGRWEWLKRTDPTLSWSRLPSKREPAVQAMAQASISVAL